MLKFLIFFLLSPSFCFANIDVYCKREISYSYINGIMNDERQIANKSVLLIYKKVKVTKEINLAFNQSKGMFFDIKDALFQKAEESTSLLNRVLSWTWSTTNLSNYIDNRISVINSLNENAANAQEHIVFSHSQGNLYANIACNSEDLKLKFHNIQIASPASRIECGKKNHYTTINSDEMYAFVDATARGASDIEEGSPYSFLIKELGGVVARPMGVLTNMEPPMKANIVQSTRSVASVLNEKSLDAKLFKNHLIDNYLNFGPSLKHIKNNYQEIYNRLKPDNVLLTSKHTNVSCTNIDKFIGKDILESSFTVKGQQFKYSVFKTYYFAKTDTDGKYVFIEENLWWKKVIFFLLAIPMLLLFIKILPFILIAMSTSTDEEEKESEDQ